jgi:hypothetical protein
MQTFIALQVQALLKEDAYFRRGWEGGRWLQGSRELAIARENNTKNTEGRQLARCAGIPARTTFG